MIISIVNMSFLLSLFDRVYVYAPCLLLGNCTPLGSSASELQAETLIAGGASAPPAVPDTAIQALQGHFPISWLLILSLLLYLQKALHRFYTLDLTNI